MQTASLFQFTIIVTDDTERCELNICLWETPLFVYNLFQKWLQNVTAPNASGPRGKHWFQFVSPHGYKELPVLCWQNSFSWNETDVSDTLEVFDI